MKKFMMVMALVFAFVMGVCGRNIVSEIKKQNDEKFVVTAIYQDEVYPGSAHDTKFDKITIVGPDRYAAAKTEGKDLVYVIYDNVGEVGKLTFTKEYRKSDDQSRVIIKKDGCDDKCVTYTGNLMRSVVMTELDNL